MTITQSPWVVWGVLSLALFGAWFLATRARDGVRGAAGWLADWLHGRINPPWWWKPWLYRRAEEPFDEGPPSLPPEQSWEQMTSYRLPVVGMSPAERKHWHQLERARKRRAARAEAEHRAAYVEMGFEYPSGLMARVREAAL